MVNWLRRWESGSTPMPGRDDAMICEGAEMVISGVAISAA